MSVFDFGTHPLFEGLSETAVTYLDRLAEAIVIDAGTHLCCQDGPSRGLFLLHHGSARVTQRMTPGGPELTIAELHAPTLIGEMELVSDRPSLCTVTAITPCQGVLLPHDRFRDLLFAGDPTAARLTCNIAKTVVSRLVAANQRYLEAVAPQDFRCLSEALTGCWPQRTA